MNRDADETLDVLAQRHGTDKARGRHNYTDVYELFFGPWRNQPVTILEIGVKAGASMRLWRDYFQSGRIFGISTIKMKP